MLNLNPPSFYYNDIKKYEKRKKNTYSKSMDEIDMSSIKNFISLNKKRVSDKHGSNINSQDMYHYYMIKHY